jgi:hypothetical protein
MTTLTDNNAASGQSQMDAALRHYVSWREESRAVRQAYHQWAQSTRAERRPAYAGYLAALDREGHAARVYADQMQQARVDVHPGSSSYV